MKLYKALFVSVLLATSFGAWAQEIEITSPPDAMYLTKEGDQIREYNVEVKAVGRRHIEVEFSDGDRHTYRVPDDFRFNIDNTPTPLSEIYPRQDLQVFMYYKDGEYSLANPGSWDLAEDEPVEIVATAPRTEPEMLEPRDEPESEPAPAMPKTAGILPLFALIGAGMLIAAGALRIARRSAS